MPALDLRRRPDTEGGFTLITVLWTLGLLALIVGGFLVVARTEVRLAANARQNAEALALAEAAVPLAIIDILASANRTIERRRFPLDGVTVGCVLTEDGTLAVRVEDEAGKVDLNGADLDLLRALFTGLGHDRTTAMRLAETILDFRDPDQVRRMNGAESDDYRQAGLPGPKNAPFEAIEELGQLPGFTAAVLEPLLPLVTVYSESRGIDPAVATPRLLAVLTQSPGARAGDAPALRLRVPAAFVATSRGTAYTVRAAALTRSGARAGVTAVVVPGRRAQRPYTIRRWQRRAPAIGVDEPVRMDGPC
jgi:general secretion pathway protein K